MIRWSVQPSLTESNMNIGLAELVNGWKRGDGEQGSPPDDRALPNRRQAPLGSSSRPLPEWSEKERDRKVGPGVAIRPTSVPVAIAGLRAEGPGPGAPGRTARLAAERRPRPAQSSRLPDFRRRRDRLLRFRWAGFGSRGRFRRGRRGRFRPRRRGRVGPRRPGRGLDGRCRDDARGCPRPAGLVRGRGGDVRRRRLTVGGQHAAARQQRDKAGASHEAGRLRGRRFVPASRAPPRPCTATPRRALARRENAQSRFSNQWWA